MRILMQVRRVIDEWRGRRNVRLATGRQTTRFRETPPRIPATVALPDYFENLNRDFRYQLTCIGGHAPVYVAQKVRGNRFQIAGGKPGMEVSWQVTGIRKDPWAEQNRIVPEVPKPKAERGSYLFPAGYASRQTDSKGGTH